MDQQPLRRRLDELLTLHREALHDCLDRVTEQEARASLVPSSTTLLGLVKHATYVERFYFGHVITGRSLAELGVASTPARSFLLRAACQESRDIAGPLGLDHAVTGRKLRSVWEIYLQMLRELAQHCGHADILREQILAARRARAGK